MTLACRILLGVIAATISAIGLRYALWAMALVWPHHVLASELVQQALFLRLPDFLISVMLGSLGGLVSLFREIREDGLQKFRLFIGVGHMVTAQFAAVMMFLLASHLEWPQFISLASCGLAGWMGNRALEAMERALTRHLPWFGEADDQR